jgi:hypothetical protein
MADFDIDDIREEIKELSYNEKLAFLEEKETEIREELEATELLLSDITSLIDKIETEKNDKICKQILQALKDNGYDMELDRNGNLSFCLGKTDVTIIMDFSFSRVELLFNAGQKQLQTRELINSILPEFKVYEHYYKLQVPEKDICKCVVGVVDKLMSHKDKILSI